MNGRGPWPFLVVIAGAMGCSFPLWLIPEPDESHTEEPEIGPLRDSGLLPRRDTGPDVSDTRRDTLVPRDTKPPGCEQPLADAFVCAPATSKVGEMVCTDAMLNELVAACITPGDETCSAKMAKYPACAKCAFETWVYGLGFFDTGACIRAVDPGNRCADLWRCANDCLTEVCAECAEDEISGCWSHASEIDGACYAIATRDLQACEADPRLRPCFVKVVADLLPFLRGACRDGACWDVADAAVDATTD